MADILSALEKFGLPALITALGGAVVTRLSRAPKSEPIKEVLHWLDSDATRRLTVSDPALADILAELQKSLAFERAFGVRAEGGRREALFRFWSAKKGRFTMLEVGQGSRNLRWDGESFQSRSLFVSYSDRTIRWRAFISRHRQAFFGVALMMCYGLVLFGLASESTLDKILYTGGGLALLVVPFTWSSSVNRLEVSDALIQWSREEKKR